MKARVKAIPEGFHTLIPTLVVHEGSGGCRIIIINSGIGQLIHK
jgi:hypothetical protein